jgi:hypothetical protein
MWLVLFSCLPPGLDPLPQEVGAADTAATARPDDDSGIDGDDDSGADDSAPIDLDDSAALPDDDTAAPAPTACDWMRWNNVGAPFFTTWCTACHAAGLEERQGAPADCNLDSHAGVVAWAPSIAAKLETGAMPPQGTPPEDTTSAVLQWLECGAPE